MQRAMVGKAPGTERSDALAAGGRRPARRWRALLASETLRAPPRQGRPMLGAARQPRHLEWWLARFTCIYGFWILLIPESMSVSGYQVVRAWMDPFSWGSFAVTVGLIHMGALVTNGRWKWSPVPRSMAAAFNAFFFAILGTGFAKADETAISVAIYLFGLSWAGLVAFASAWGDSVRLICHKSETKRD